VTGDRLTGSDKRALLLWVAAGILGIVFAQKYFFRAFPEASVNFQVSREEALARAQKFVSGLGENVSDYRSAWHSMWMMRPRLTWSVNWTCGWRTRSCRRTFTYGIGRCVSLSRNKRRVSRAREPRETDVGYVHKIEESRAGPSLDRAAGETVAQIYLTRNWNGFESVGRSPEEANSQKSRTAWIGSSRGRNTDFGEDARTGCR